MAKIVLELDFHEAHFLLPAVSDRRLVWSKEAASAKDEPYREYSDVAATVLGRIESTLCDLMYPEPKVTEYL